MAARRRVDANRVPDDDYQDEARHDVTNREIVHDRRLRQQGERQPRGGDAPRRSDERRDVRLIA